MEKRTSRKSSRERLSELINMLREEIVTGKRPIGDYLPAEKTLAEDYNLSNQSVRKGLETLVAEGLIEKIPRVGTKVIGLHDDSIPTVKLGFHSSVTGEADMHRLLELFQQTNPHIRVLAVPTASNNYSYIRDYLANGMLDVVMMNYTNFQEFMENDAAGLLEPQERNPDLYPILSDAFMADGRQLVQPFIFSPLILCYNREHFREAQLSEPDSSWQWKDLIEASSKLAIPNERLGFHCDLYSMNRWPLLLLQHGGKFERQEDGRLKLAGTRMMDALRYCGEMKQHIPSLRDGSVTGESELFLAKGKVSMIMTSYFYLNYLLGEHLSFDVAPVPHLGTPMTMLLNTGLAVNRKSQVKEASVTLVEFLTSYQAQLFVRQHTYSLPARKAAAEYVGEEKRYRPTRFSLFRETIPSFRYFTDLNISASELSRINQELKLYWAGLETEEALCSQIEESYTAVSPV
ncbi:extracellular solute-binding protein [Paenibacillus eucommiae]|uniref:Multiple sugar transport system substrate-binding protein n=1 Tax=Paenibacillus eucommiae TaxID=1355755 RepID=A0ABS4J6Z7_9BACL|nr:extracellular solute-binding protein [Paenibacillus eucommiae]MBP1995580.1 multiple sugar transport system substrate-binding protein [Paenibacillus eucommiae]